MKPTTRKRYERIRQAAAHMIGTMPVMHLYAALARDFGYSEEHIRRILSKTMHEMQKKCTSIGTIVQIAQQKRQKGGHICTGFENGTLG